MKRSKLQYGLAALMFAFLCVAGYFAVNRYVVTSQSRDFKHQEAANSVDDHQNASGTSQSAPIHLISDEMVAACSGSEAKVLKAMQANRAKCPARAAVTWTLLNTRTADDGTSKEYRGKFEQWWDGNRIATRNSLQVPGNNPDGTTETTTIGNRSAFDGTEFRTTVNEPNPKGIETRPVPQYKLGASWLTLIDWEQGPDIARVRANPVAKVTWTEETRDGKPFAQRLARNPADEKAPKLAALRPRCDASHDWTQAEVVALLDDITAISTAPVSWAAIPMESSEMWKVRTGEPLPIELKSAAWGTPAENGLRAAWLLEPRAEQYPLGTVLKARVLFHNTGTKPVVFKTETWHQDDPHTARNAKGGVINVDSTFYTGETPMATYRLEQGEYVAVLGHGIGIGAGPYIEERSTGSIGAWIEATKGDEVSFSSLVDASREGWTSLDDPKDPIELWKLVVLKRVEREAPLPATAADREQLIRHVTRDLFGESPTAEEIATFTADNAPDALGKLAARLQAKPRVEPFSGKLPTGETKFRVIAADPNAAKAPRTANSPGRYVLGDGVHLLVSQLTEGDNRTNKATIAFLSPDPKVASPHKPHEFALPDGVGTYGIVWDRGSGALWVMQEGMVRKYEFANPSQVREMKIEPGNILNIPAHLQEPMKKAFDVLGAAVQKQMPVKPAAAATPKLPKLPDDAYAKPGFHCQKFREEDAKRPGGERMGAVLEPSKPEVRDKEPLVLGVRTASDAQWHIGGTARVGLVVRNRSDSDVKFAYTLRYDKWLSVVAVDGAGKEHKAAFAQDGLLDFQRMLLPAAHVATIAEFTIRFDPEKRDVTEAHTPAFHLPPGKYKLRFTWNDSRPELAHEGEWTGELVNEELGFTLAAGAEPATVEPKSGAPVPQAVETEKPKTTATELQPKATEKEPFTAWGKEIGGLQAGLGFKYGNRRTYGHGQGITLVVRLRNVGKEAVKFEYLRQFLDENPPTVTNADDKTIPQSKTEVMGQHVPVIVTLEPGKEMVLETRLHGSSGVPYVLIPPNSKEKRDDKVTPLVVATGKVQLQIEKVFGNSSSGFLKVDPALEKLSTGKLELEVIR